MCRPALAAVPLFLLYLLAGCTTHPEVSGWNGFQAVYEDAQGSEYILALDGPHRIADSFGVPREAYALNVSGAGVNTPTTIYLDGALRVIRVDRPCMDGPPCRYDEVHYADIRTPAPFGIGLAAGQEVVVDVYGTSLTSLVKRAPIGDDEGLLLSMEIPRAAGISVVGRWIPQEDTLAPLAMAGKWPTRPAGVELRLTSLEKTPPLRTIAPWPPRPATTSLPGDLSDLLAEPWLGHPWVPEDALDTLLQESDLAASIWANDGCITQVEVDGPAHVEARGISGGNESPGITRFILADRDGLAAEFQVQYGGDVLLDEVQGPSWRVTQERRLAELGACENAPSAGESTARWHDGVRELVRNAQAVAMASVQARWQPGTPHPIPAEWSHTMSLVVLQPDHVSFEPNTVTSWTPYTISRDGNGALIEVVVHPDDRTSLDAGEWTAYLA